METPHPLVIHNSHPLFINKNNPLFSIGRKINENTSPLGAWGTSPPKKVNKLPPLLPKYWDRGNKNSSTRDNSWNLEYTKRKKNQKSKRITDRAQTKTMYIKIE